MTRAQAEAAADALVSLWRERGHVVRAWVEKEPSVRGAGITAFTYRSDMVNGLPRTHPAIKAKIARRAEASPLPGLPRRAIKP